MSENILEIKDLVVHYETDDGCVKAINGLTLSVGKEKTLGLVGETGAGKTTTALSILNLVPSPPGVIKGGSIELDGKDVLQTFMERLPMTLALGGSALIVACIISVPLGIYTALNQNTWKDTTGMVFALFGVSMPNFWLGLMLIVIFAAGLGWFPSSNFETWGALVLPAITLSANSLAMITRMTRSSMLETIRQDYIRTARAKGLKESVITIRHALRNAMIPIVTTVGLQFGFSLGGAVLVETVFSWPGIGRLLVDCIKLKDTPVVVACVLVLATMFTIINLCIDILYAFLDPRIRAQYKTVKG